ncbi:MAG: hypothetical protein ACRD9S_13155 [Pyrinomonadaceae bacterium]
MPLILAKSSSGDPYEVAFWIDNGRLFAQCACAASEQQQFCKHLAALFCGDCSMLFQPDQEPLLLEVLEGLTAAGILAAYAEFQSELKRLETEWAAVKKRIEKERKGFKASFMRKLAAGYPVTVTQ